MITINGREYNEKHIGFKGGTTYPTAECFIYIWQTSSSKEEFQQRMSDVYWYDLQKNNPVEYDDRKAAGYVYKGYSQPTGQATRLRSDYRIPLKYLSARGRKPDWAALRKFAESLNDEQ